MKNYVKVMGIMLILLLVLSITTPIFASDENVYNPNQTINICVGETRVLESVYLPVRISCRSLDETVVKVTEYGTIMGVNPGRATVIVRKNIGVFFDYIKEQKYQVIVTEPSIKERCEVEKGSKLQLKTGNTYSKVLRWQSSNDSIISVDNKGIITGKKEGTALVTAYMKTVKWKNSHIYVLNPCPWAYIHGGAVHDMDWYRIKIPRISVAKKTFEVTVLPSGIADGYFLISFDSNGGSIVNKQIVADNDCVIEPNDPVKTNYYFNGWFVDESFEEEFNFLTPVHSDLNLYASWDEVISPETQFSVHFESEGDNVVNMPDEQSIKVGENAIEPDEPIREGYDFVYWVSSNGEVYDFSNPVENDITLTAKWINDQLLDEMLEDPSIQTVLESMPKIAKESTLKVERQLDSEMIDGIIVECTTETGDKPMVTVLDEGSMFASTVGLIGQPVEIYLPSGADVESASISFHYNKDKLEIDPSRLGIVWFDENLDKVVLLENTTIDTQNSVVSTQTNHFSKYVVVDKEEFNDAWSRVQYASRTDNKPYYNLVLSLDCSGSMSGTSISSCISATQKLIESLGDDDMITVLAFDDYSRVVVKRTKITETLEDGTVVNNKEYINSLVGKMSASGGTSIENAIGGICNQLITFNSLITDPSSYNPYNPEQYQSISVLLSDGGDTVSKDTIKRLAAYDTYVITIGFGSNVNTSLMQEIADASDGVYKFCSNENDVVDLFRQIQDEYIGSTIDTDGDSLPDLVEENGMRNQYGEIIVTDPNNKDTDGDGISDGKEAGSYDSTSRHAFFHMESNPVIPTVYKNESYIEALDMGIDVDYDKPNVFFARFIVMVYYHVCKDGEEVFYDAPKELKIELNRDSLPKNWNVVEEGDVREVYDLEEAPFDNDRDTKLYYKTYTIKYKTTKEESTILVDYSSSNLGKSINKQFIINSKDVKKQYDDELINKTDEILSCKGTKIDEMTGTIKQKTIDVADSIKKANINVVDDGINLLKSKLDITSTNIEDEEFNEAVLDEVAVVMFNKVTGLKDSDYASADDMWSALKLTNQIASSIIRNTFPANSSITVGGRNYPLTMNFYGTDDRDIWMCSWNCGGYIGSVTIKIDELQERLDSYTKKLEKLKKEEIESVIKSSITIVTESAGITEKDCKSYINQICGKGWSNRRFKNIVKNTFKDGNTILTAARSVMYLMDKKDHVGDLYDDIQNALTQKKGDKILVYLVDLENYLNDFGIHI